MVDQNLVMILLLKLTFFASEVHKVEDTNKIHKLRTSQLYAVNNAET